jgi:hypothetical protein
MMGVQAASAQLFYDFCLDDHVPSDHLLRGIDGHLDFEDLRQTLKPFYSWIGRLAWLVKQKGITPLIPVFDKSNRTAGTTGFFNQKSFRLDPLERDPWALVARQAICSESVRE